VLLVIVWPGYKTNTDIAKKLNTTPVLDKMQDYSGNWIQHVKRMPLKRLPKILKNYRPKGRKKARETTDETTECMRPEQVNKWPNSMIAR
jgi:hypothetical protein